MQARYLEVPNALVVPDPSLAYGAHMPLPFLVLAVVHSVAGVLLFIAPLMPQFLLSNVIIWPEVASEDMGSGFSAAAMCLYLHHSGVVRAPVCGTLARKRDVA